MPNPAEAYAQTAQTSLPPRDLEASVLLRAAARLQAARDNWQAGDRSWEEALQHNRQLWVILSSAVAEKDNPLPAEIKSNLLSLAAFIFKHTLAMEADPSPDKLDDLIRFNREIAAGLQAKPGA